MEFYSESGQPPGLRLVFMTTTRKKWAKIYVENLIGALVARNAFYGNVIGITLNIIIFIYFTFKP